MNWGYGPHPNGRGQGDYPFLVLRVIDASGADRLLTFMPFTIGLVSDQATPNGLKWLLPGAAPGTLSFETDGGITGARLRTRVLDRRIALDYYTQLMYSRRTRPMVSWS